MNKDLISEIADKIKENATMESVENQMRLHCARLKEIAGPQLFKQLAEALEASIETLKSKLHPGGETLGIRADEGSVNIRSEDCPFVKFSLKAPDYSGTLSGVYNAGYHKPLHGNDKVMKVALKVAADDTVYFSHEDQRKDPDELADDIVKMLFVS